MRNIHILLMILVPSFVTFLLRFAPFAFLGQKKNLPQSVKDLGDILPMANMAVLIVYCMRDVSTGYSLTHLCMVVSVLVTAITHIFKKNTILSIVVGTACYMIMLRML